VVRMAVRLQFLDSNLKELHMLQLSVVQKAKLTIQPVDKKGNPAPVDGVPTWKTSVDGLVSLFPSDDGMSCDVSGVAIGTVQVQVEADADLGTGVVTISGVLDVTVTPAQAVAVAIAAGPLEDQ